MEERLDKQFNFIMEIDKEKAIKRQTLTSDGSTLENDAEHAWHMAIMAMLLKEHANKETDLLRVIEMLLIHDLVEIDAGDTYAYDEIGKQTQAKREEQAAKRIFNLLPQDQAEFIYQLFREFEDNQTPEANFAHTMDNIQPMMLNHATDGKMWVKNKVKYSSILKRNAITPLGSKTLWDYAHEHFIKPNLEQGKIENE